MGHVEEIWLRPRPTAAPRRVARASATAGVGLDGDRYAAGIGTFSDVPGTGRQLTLIEAEALEALARETGISLTPADARRNVVTRGADLNGLVGRRFRVGPVECVGRRLCEPCAHLDEQTTAGVLHGLAHRGGLRADILAGGEITVGDPVVALDGPA